MNLVPIIAQALDLVLGEEFLIEGDTHRYRFKENQIEVYSDYNGWTKCSMFIYKSIVSGNAIVKKIPYIPDVGETYYHVMWGYDDETDKNVIIVSSSTWNGSYIDWALFRAGNCFSTESEAESKKIEVYETQTGSKYEPEIEE